MPAAAQAMLFLQIVKVLKLELPRKRCPVNKCILQGTSAAHYCRLLLIQQPGVREIPFECKYFHEGPEFGLKNRLDVGKK
jgi:hypothetical protein